MTDDERLEQLNKQMVKALSETEKWASLAKQLDEELAAADKLSPDYERLREEHGLAHSMASSNQKDLEDLFDVRDRMLDRRADFDEPLGPGDEELNATFDEVDEWEPTLLTERSIENDSPLRGIANEHLANAGDDEGTRLNAELDALERSQQEIQPEHMQLANDVIRGMEERHLAHDQTLTEDQQIQRLGESHLALYEAGREVQEMTPPPPPVDPNLNPAVKMKL